MCLKKNVVDLMRASNIAYKSALPSARFAQQFSIFFFTVANIYMVLQEMTFFSDL